MHATAWMLASGELSPDHPVAARGLAHLVAVREAPSGRPSPLERLVAAVRPSRPDERSVPLADCCAAA